MSLAGVPGAPLPLSCALNNTCSRIMLNFIALVDVRTRCQAAVEEKRCNVSHCVTPATSKTRRIAVCVLVYKATVNQATPSFFASVYSSKMYCELNAGTGLSSCSGCLLNQARKRCDGCGFQSRFTNWSKWISAFVSEHLCFLQSVFMCCAFSLSLMLVLGVVRVARLIDCCGCATAERLPTGAG